MRHGSWIGALVIFVSLFWLGSACEHTWYAVSGATVQGTVVSKAVSRGTRGNNHHGAYRLTLSPGGRGELTRRGGGAGRRGRGA